MVAPVVGRDQWLKLRREPRILLGASSAAAACGMSAHESALHLHHRLLGNIPEDDLSGNDAVHFGNALESAIVREYGRRLGRRVLNPRTEREEIERLLTADGGCRVVAWVDDFNVGEDSVRLQPMCVSTARPWQSATLDAVAIDEHGDLEIGEVKNQGEYRSSEWGVDEPAPQDYRLQALHQLAVVTAAKRVMLAALVGGNKFRSFPVERSADVDSLVKIETAFMDGIARGEEPIADGSESTRAALRALHPDDNGESIVLPGECVEIHARLLELDAELEKFDQLDAEKKALRARLEQLIGDATFGELPDGRGAYSFKTQEKRIALPAKELPDEYVRTSKSRVLRFAAPKSNRSK